MLNGRRLIALCTSRIYDPYIFSFVETLNNKLNEADCSLLIFTLNSDLYWRENELTAERAVFDIIPYDMVDAIILMDERIKSHSIATRIISRARRHQLPVIVVDGHYRNTVSINFDYRSGFEAVTRHIIEHHHSKRPHMIAGIKGNPFSDERIDVFKRVLSENNTAFDDSMLSYGEFWAHPAREATLNILKRDVLPDAIICANDIMAINVCDTLTSNGIDVPEQIMVSGFDGYDEVFFTSPKITTALCNYVLLSEATVATTLKCLNKEKADNQLITPKLIENESCGCPSCLSHSKSVLNRFNDESYRYQDDIREMNRISTRMQTSESPTEMAACLNDPDMQDLYVVINKKCFNVNHNMLLDPPGSLLHREYCLIYDSSQPDQKIKKVRSILPLHWSDEAIEEFLSGHYPLVFNALDYMDKPLGFICYAYKNLDITNYAKACSITNTISMGIGGYINMRYQKMLSEKVDEMYIRDSLTKLYNRIGFYNIYNKLKASPKNLGKPITVIMTDLNGLKYINDNYGHASGDNAIATSAAVLKKACPKRAICARFGGDELFAVILGECNTKAILGRMETLFNDFNDNSGLPYSVISSAGSHTEILTPDFDLSEALKIADSKMYVMKRQS